MNINEIKAEFKLRSESYEKLALIVESILKLKIESSGIKIASLTTRVKGMDKFLEKIDRKKYFNPFKEMNDIVGARVVCLYSEDLEIIGKLIEGAFKVTDKDNKREELGFDKMGYQDLSFVACLVEEHFGELRQYTFEIQVRTIMSDAVAHISHDLNYKKEQLLPDNLKRELNLVFSTMELTQYHCDALREKRKEFVKEIEIKAKNVDQADFLNQPITDDTLRIYTQKRFPGLPIKEHIHDLILKDLDMNKYKILRDIDTAIECSKGFVDYYKTQSDSFKSGSDFITKSLGFYDNDFLQCHPFAQKTREAVEEYKRKMV